MNKTKSFFMLSAALLLAASCSNEMAEVENNNEPVAAVINGSIAGNVTTRAFDTTWENSDAIGVFNGTTGQANNKYVYTTNGDGNSKFVAEGGHIFIKGENDNILTAYYPYSSEISQGRIPFDVRYENGAMLQEEPKVFDFMHASETTANRTNPDVNFQFTHKMAKLKFILKPSDEVGFYQLQHMHYMITGDTDESTNNDGAIYNAHFGIKDGNFYQLGNYENRDVHFYAEPETLSTIVIDKDNQTISASFFMIPQQIHALRLKADNGGTPFYSNLDFTSANAKAGDSEPQNELKGGRQYNINVTVGSKGATINGIIITGWEEVDTDDFTALQ